MGASRVSATAAVSTLIRLDLAGAIPPLAVFHVMMLAAGLLVLTTGSGVLLSVIVRRTTTAVTLNLVLYILLWVGLPLGDALH